MSYFSFFPLQETAVLAFSTCKSWVSFLIFSCVMTLISQIFIVQKKNNFTFQFFFSFWTLKILKIFPWKTPNNDSDKKSHGMINEHKVVEQDLSASSSALPPFPPFPMQLLSALPAENTLLWSQSSSFKVVSWFNFSRNAFHLHVP